MTADQSTVAPDRLRWIAKASIILGLASLLRFLPEMISVLPKNPSGRYFAMVALDLVVGAIWLKCGLALRKHGRGAIGFAAIGGAILLAHAVTSGIVIGREILRDLSRPHHADYFLFLAVAGSRFLIYGIEFLFWPWAISILFRSAEDPEGDPSSRRSVVLATIASFLIAAVVQLIILAGIFDR